MPKVSIQISHASEVSTNMTLLRSLTCTFYFQESNDENGLDDSQNESLIEALDNTNGTNDLAYAQDPDQITDYPRHSSSDIRSSQISLNGSIRSSLSAISESSLTSDYSYDANRKPMKKILKNPHRPRRRARKNVRWNLQENDSDTTSLDSFDSTSTSSSLYFHARNGVNEARQNWREFERSPPRGSTGLTPLKPQIGNRLITRPSSAPTNVPFTSFSNFVPQLEPTQEHVQSSSFGNQLNPANTSQGMTRFARSPSPQERLSLSHSPTPPSRATHTQNSQYVPRISPLTSTPSNVTHHSVSSGFEKLTRTVHTPMRRHHSDTVIHRSPSPNPDSSIDNSQNKFDKNSSSDDIDSPLVLQLSDSKVPELEESTLEDRRRMHIFQFPQSTKSNSNPSPPVHATSKVSPRTAFLEEDDKGDYDHLSPLESKKESTTSQLKGHDLIANMVIRRDKQIDRTSRKLLRSFTDDDLEDALKQIGEDDSQDSSQDSLPNELNPPPIPVKHKKGRLASAEVGEQKTSGLGLQRRSSDPINSNPTSPSRQPPPVPPKLNRIKRDGKGTVVRSVTREEQANDSSDGKNGENILPPPPEFAAPSYTTHSSDSSPPKSDDALGSTSTSTLIAEQDVDANNKHSQGSEGSHPDKDKSWGDSLSLKIGDRIVVGAEDPRSSADGLHSVSKHHQSSSIAPRFGNSQKTGISFSHLGQREQNSSSYLQPQRNPTYKLSMETAFNEGNLLRNNAFLPQNRYPPEQAKRSTVVPHRPAPLPPVSRKVSSENHSTPFLAGINQQPRKPVDPSVKQLLSDLSIEDESHQHSYSNIYSKLCLHFILLMLFLRCLCSLFKSDSEPKRRYLLQQSFLPH